MRWLVLAIIAGSCGAEPVDSARPAEAPRSATEPTSHPTSPAMFTRVPLPLPGAPFPGYWSGSRCTLIDPLPWRALGFGGPVFQCGNERFLSVSADAELTEVTVRVDGAEVTVEALHSSVRPRHRRPTAWVGTTLLEGGEDGLRRVRVGRPPTSEPYGTGLEGAVLDIQVEGDRVWVVSREAVFIGGPEGDSHAFVRALAFADLPSDGPGSVGGDFVELAPVGEGRFVLSHTNFGRADLFLVDGRDVRVLEVPPAAPRPSTPGAEGVGGPSPPDSPPGGGATAPRRHRPVRLGDRVLVGARDDRVLELRGDALVELEASPALPNMATSNLGRSPSAASAPDGTAVLVMNGQLHVCDATRCRLVESERTTYGHVEHVEGHRFLVIFNEPDGGAAILDAAAVP